jgi:hypothetical protein
MVGAYVHDLLKLSIGVKHKGHFGDVTMSKFAGQLYRKKEDWANIPYYDSHN